MMLMIRGQMRAIRTKCLGVLAVLLFSSFAVSSDYTKDDEKECLNQLLDPATGKINGNLAELLWMSCKQDLHNLKEAFEDLKLHLPEEARSSTNDIDKKCYSLGKESFQKLINVLHPKLKRSVSDCIRKNKLLFQESGKDSSFKTCYPRYSESLIRWCEVSRRSLTTQTFAVDSTSNLGPPLPRSSAPAPSLSYESPDSSTDLSLSVKLSTPQLTIHKKQAEVEEGELEEEESEEEEGSAIIIACVATAGVTSLIALVVLFVCCHNDSESSLNDESPLLSLRGDASDPFHADESSNESNLQKNASTNGIESDALQISLDGESSDGNAGSASTESSEAPGNAGSQVPLPPGKAGPDGLPPLNPPPAKDAPQPPFPANAPPPPLPPSAGPRPPGPPPPPAPPGAPPPPPPKGGAPPPPPHSKGGAPPPPPSKGGAPPLPPSKGGAPQRPPPSLGSNAPRPPVGLGCGPGSGDAKAKLKPFFWDKVANTPEQGQVWSHIKAGSFQFNEEKIETLFGYAPIEKSKSDKKESSKKEPQFIQLLDAKKAQNLSILLKALNVTSEEVSDALVEGNELPTELVQTLLKMAPTQEEELKLRLYTGEITKLGPAERFLKVLVDIPHAYKKMETLLYMCSLHDELTASRESFQILESACKELKSSRLFLKLLEAVLKTGNRMNDGTFRGGAMAFKLDTLLKLSDVKGVDGKTTLLHFVVQEIIRAEGLRAARAARESKSFSSIKSDDLLEDVPPDGEEHYRSLGLQKVTNLSSELEYVKKAAALDAENLTSTVSRIGQEMVKARNFLNTEMKDSDEKSGFHDILKSFVQNAEADVMLLLEEEKKVMELVKSTGDYFHGNVKKDEGLRLFTVVRDFLIILDKVCREVKDAPIKPPPKKQVSNASTTSESPVAPPTPDPHAAPPPPVPRPVPPPSPDPRQKLANALSQQRLDHSSSHSSSDENDASCTSESFVAPPSPDPRQKLANVLSQQRLDNSNSDFSSDENDASCTSESLVAPPVPDPRAAPPPSSDPHAAPSPSPDPHAAPPPPVPRPVPPPSPDPRQKLANALSQQSLDNSSSDFSSDENDASCTFESLVAPSLPDPRAAPPPSSDPHAAPPPPVPRPIPPPSPDPRQKLANALYQQMEDNSSSDSSLDENNASCTSESLVAPPLPDPHAALPPPVPRPVPPSFPDPRQKLANALSQQRVDNSSSDSSSDENS